MRRATLLFALALTLATGLTACSSPKYITGTQIADTKKNREIVQVIEKYRRAMIQRDVPTLIALAHPDYYQDKNSADFPPYDYKGLKKRLVEQFKLIKSVRMDLQYRRITWDSPEKVQVEVYMDASFQIKVGDASEWKKKDDYAKFVLKKEEGRFLFLTGL